MQHSSMNDTVSVTHNHIWQENSSLRVLQFLWRHGEGNTVRWGTGQSVTRHHIPENPSPQTTVSFRATLGLLGGIGAEHSYIPPSPLSVFPSPHFL